MVEFKREPAVLRQYFRRGALPQRCNDLAGDDLISPAASDAALTVVARNERVNNLD
jgi:hypothetical protein